MLGSSSSISSAACRICSMLVVQLSEAGTAAAKPSPPAAPPARRWSWCHLSTAHTRRSQLFAAHSGPPPLRRLDDAIAEMLGGRGEEDADHDPGRGGGEVGAKGPVAKGSSNGGGGRRREWRRGIGGGIWARKRGPTAQRGRDLGEREGGGSGAERVTCKRERRER
jgi:hypothetical protein